MKSLYLPLAAIALSLTSGCYENFSNPVPLAAVRTSAPLGTQPLSMSTSTDDNIYCAVAYNYIDSGFDLHQAWMQRSEDQGRSWIDPQPIVTLQYFNGLEILADATNATWTYAAWIGQDFSGSYLWGMSRSQADFHGWEEWAAFEVDAQSRIELAQNPTSRALVTTVSDGSRIKLSKSADTGFSWSDPTTIILGDADVFVSVCGLAYEADGTLMILYSVTNQDQNPSYFIRHSEDDGTNWSARTRVNSTVSGTSDLGGALALASDGGLHAVWSTDANFKHAYSADGGHTWEPNSLLGYTTAFNHTLTVAGATVVWGRNTVDYAAPNDYNFVYQVWDSATWSIERRVNNVLNTSSQNGEMAVTADGTLVASWKEDSNSFQDPESAHCYTAYSAPNPVENYGVSLVSSSCASETRRGDTFEFDFVVGNYTDASATVNAWVQYARPNGDFRTLRTYENIELEAGEERTLRYSTTVRPNVPFGEYMLSVVTDELGAPEHGDRDSFITTVVRN